MIKFLLFVAMLFLGATSIPRLMFLLFLPNSGSEFPPSVITDIVVSFGAFIVVSAGFVVISNWIRKQEDVFY